MIATTPDPQQLTTVIGHQIRTPLSVIATFAEIVAEGQPSEDTQAEFLGIIHSESKRLSRLVDEILQFHALEQGTLEIHPIPFRLEPALPEIVNRCQASVGSIVDLDLPTLPPVRVDPLHFRQAFGILLESAARCSEPSDRLGIRAATRGGAVGIQVATAHWGLPEGGVGRLFEKHALVAGGEDRGVPDTGLSMALAKALIEAQGGRVWARRSNGSVTCFLLLPTAEAVPND